MIIDKSFHSLNYFNPSVYSIFPQDYIPCTENSLCLCSDISVWNINSSPDIYFLNQVFAHFMHITSLLKFISLSHHGQKHTLASQSVKERGLLRPPISGQINYHQWWWTAHKLLIALKCYADSSLVEMENHLSGLIKVLICLSSFTDHN